MVSSSDLIRMIASKLQEYKAANIVVDPVMVATSGAKLLSDDAIETLKKGIVAFSNSHYTKYSRSRSSSGYEDCK